MNVKIGEKVSVNFLYNHETNQARPHYLKWKDRVYVIQKIGLHYTLYKGNALIHIFSAITTAHFVLLAFNTKNLHWTLEEIADITSN